MSGRSNALDVLAISEQVDADIAKQLRLRLL